MVRHGQSTWNAAGRWQGQEDPPLSTRGVREARVAATVLGGFDAVVASDLQRALVTAEVIAGELGIGPVVADHRLRERHAGAFQGLTRTEIDERFPGYLPPRSGHGADHRAAGSTATVVPRRPDGWEPDDAVLLRATEALAQVAATVGPGGTALIVTHGGVIRLLDVAGGAEAHGVIPNLAGRWFEIGLGRFRAGERVELVDEAELIDHDADPHRV